MRKSVMVVGDGLNPEGGAVDKCILGGGWKGMISVVDNPKHEVAYSISFRDIGIRYADSAIVEDIDFSDCKMEWFATHSILDGKGEVSISDFSTFEEWVEYFNAYVHKLPPLTRIRIYDCHS